MLQWLYYAFGGIILIAANGFFLYRICSPFVRMRKGRAGSALLFLTMGGSSGMVIWIGDPNLLYTTPVYFVLFMLSTRGDWVGRLSMCSIFFCIEMSVCALLDSYVRFAGLIQGYDLYDILVRVFRPVIFGGLYLLLRRRLPAEPLSLPRRLWKVVLGLAAMPLCAMLAVVLLNFPQYDSLSLGTMALSQGIVVLPFVLITSVVLLAAILILADHERLERSNQLAGLREVYYHGLRQQETQVRRLRHDMRSHLAVLGGLLESGKADAALAYLSELGSSPALSGGKHLCENETANAVLTAKVDDMERAGIEHDVAVSLPEELPISDTDLAALLGNALDNAVEGTAGAETRRINVRCKLDKGLFMLRVENTMGGEANPDLSTTKADKSSHGFGIPGMRDIAERYRGTLEATARSGRFELLVCIPMGA